MITTPFEDSGYLSRTTLGQEADYITALLAQYPAISRIDLGASPGEYPLYALKIGTGDKRPLAIITNIHPEESSPREAVLTLIRDLAEAPSMDVARLLSERALYVVPTPNPDGVPNSRLNAAGFNLNREWLSLPAGAPEIRTLSGFLYTIDPVSVLDAHEWITPSATDLFFVGAVENASGAGVRDVSEATATAVASANGGAPWYPATSMGNSRHAMSVVGVPVVLTETVVIPETAIESHSARYTLNRTAMEAWLGHLAEYAEAHELASDTAREEIAGRVVRTATTWPIDLNAPMDGSSASGLSISASGYVVPETEWDEAKTLLDLHRIDYDEANRTASLAQEKAQMAVMVLDPASPFTVSPNATRLQVPAIPPPRFGYDPAMDLYENVVT